MQYAQTGIRGYAPPGSICPGHLYEDRPDQADPHMSVNCPRCEPHLAVDPLWAGAAALVPPTKAEEQEAESVKKAAEALDARQILMFAAALATGNLGDLLAKAGMAPDALASVTGQAPAVPAVTAAPVPPAAPVAPAPAPGAAETPKAPAKAPRARKAPAKAGASA